MSNETNTRTATPTAYPLTAQGTPVSYTHLDVYKRQGYNDMITEVVSMPIEVIVAGVLHLIVYIVATYLHLQRLAQRSPLELVRKGDVYKRQPFMTVPSAAS